MPAECYTSANSRPRLVLVKLHSIEERNGILNNGKALKGLKTFVGPDLSREDRQKRRELVGKMRSLRAEKKRAYLHFAENKLFVDGKEVK